VFFVALMNVGLLKKIEIVVYELDIPKTLFVPNHRDHHLLVVVDVVVILE
jgi:hypothetical protein